MPAPKRHGRANTADPTYGAWRSMRQRCGSPQHKQYRDYGGRGIAVCARWSDFTNFLTDMGECPPGLSLERKKNDQGYTPDNCVWATTQQQANNRRSCRLVTFEGRTLTIAQWAREVGITRSSMRKRLLRWPIQKALTKESST